MEVWLRIQRNDLHKKMQVQDVIAEGLVRGQVQGRVQRLGWDVGWYGCESNDVIERYECKYLNLNV